MSRQIPSAGRCPNGARPLCAFAVSFVAMSLFTACKSHSSARARQWTRCTCSYMSDFDEPGRAPIDVCTEGRDNEEVAATCVRNDGVGIPTSCSCEATPKGPCEKSDRCRHVASER